MPYTKSPRPYKAEYKKQKTRGEHADRMERQRARRKMDATSVDANKNGKNRSFKRNSDGSVKSRQHLAGK